jgi:acetyl esterase/lipase
LKIQQQLASTELLTSGRPGVARRAILAPIWRPQGAGVMISREAREELDRLFAAKGQPRPPIAQRRREWEAAARLQVLPREARFVRADLDGMAGEWMEMPGTWPDRVLLLLHGGGYNAGSPRTHRRLAADLSRATHMRVLAPEYRLAPEHPYPAALRDALVSFGWLVRQGYPADQIVVAGDSAGGGLCLAMLLALREAGGQLPRAAVLLAPWTDLTCAGPSYGKLKKYDPVISRERLLEAAAWYAGGRDPADPMLSPLFADLGGLPPLLIHAGEDEVMVDDSRQLAERARQAGVEATCKVWPGMWHVFHGAGREIPEARQAIDEIGVFVRAQFVDELATGTGD